jgi:uncharacterized membrane protein
MSEGRFPVRTLLFISLALNILIVGAFAGAYFSGARFQRPSAEAPSDQALVQRLPGPRAFLAALPDEARADMRARFRATWGETRVLREEARVARVAAFEAASAEPFDAVAVKAAFARMRAADQAAIGAFHDVVADAFAEMSPAQRAVALEALRTAPPARREAIGPAAERAPGEAPRAQPDGSFREKMRERRERRRERQGAQPQP